MVTALLALVLASLVAATGAFLRMVLPVTGLDAVVITAVLAELAKKAAYIVVGYPDKSLSLVLAGPLMLTAVWWYRARQTTVPGMGTPLAWLAVWLGALAFFTLLNPDGSPFALAAHLVAWLWVAAASGALGSPGKGTYAVLWVAVGLGIANHLLGPDPLWAAYRRVAEPVSIGARFLPDAGYSGSIFSSPTEFGAFALAAAALLAAGPDRPRGLVLASLAGAVITGSRYVILGVMVFWGLFHWAPLGRLRPWHVIAAVLAYPFAQDVIGRWILDNPPAQAGHSVFLQRLLTVGTFGARAGFSEAWSEVLAHHWLWGVGLVDVYSLTAVYPDDRHNILLWLLVHGGTVALTSYLAFVWCHLRRFVPAGTNPSRSAAAYLVAALIMSMGGPRASSNWFFLTLGTFFYMAASLDKTGGRLTVHYQRKLS